MTMYKPGTQLIMNQLWAAAAAHELGFELETNAPNNNPKLWVRGFHRVWEENYYAATKYANTNLWRITVTESGPNAAEQFYPQRGDLIETNVDTHFVVTDVLEDDPTWVADRYCQNRLTPFVECRRIIERNGTPFPLLSKCTSQTVDTETGK